jgi:DDE superfamily endonuclease
MNLLFRDSQDCNKFSIAVKLASNQLLIMKAGWKRLILIWDNSSYHVSQMVQNYINAQKEDWLTIIHIPKKASYLNPNERKVNQQIKSDVCANRFYEDIEEQKAAVSEYLDKRFGRWHDDIIYDT